MQTCEQDLTLLLQRWSAGDQAAFEELIPAIYGDLRRLGQHYLRSERGGHTLQATALVHEVFLRLHNQHPEWQSREHFFTAAGSIMRRVLVDHARKRQAAKRQLG